MSKELPYFKFIASEWLTGNISFESLQLQGLFINICALYWNRAGILMISEIESRYKKKKMIEELSGRYFSLTDGFINIEFLDEQLAERERLSITNSMNGKKGGRGNKVENKANANRTQSETKANESNIEEEKNKKKNKRREEVELVFPFDSIAFKSKWEIWKLYRAERKIQYKGSISEQAALKKLSEISGDEQTAIKIIDESISNSWQGLFELKNGTTKAKQSANTDAERRFNILKDYHDAVNSGQK